MKPGKNDPGPVPEIGTRCLHCDQVFPPPVPVIGQPTDAAYCELATRMCDHLRKKHQKIFDAALARQIPMQTRLAHTYYMTEFVSSDPELAKYLDLTRHMFLRNSQRRISDAKLGERVASLPAFDALLGTTEPVDLVERSAVLELFKEMRDVLQEQGRYPEFDQAEQNRIILASASV